MNRYLAGRDNPDATNVDRTVISNHTTATDSETCENWVSDPCYAMAINGSNADFTGTTSDWGAGATDDEPLDIFWYSMNNQLQIVQSNNNHKLPTLSFGPSTDFAGAAIDYDDAFLAFKDSSAGTSWTTTDTNGDGYFNLADFGGPTKDDFEENLGGGGVGIGARSVDVDYYGATENSRNKPIDVTNIVQEQAAEGMNLYFMFFLQHGTARALEWNFSNGEDADASLGPWLEVYTIVGK